MHGIYKVEEMLCEELEKIGEKEELTAGSLETADKLSHALKNVQKIIEYYESMGEGGGSYDDGSYDGGSYDGSYARGRRGGRTGANQYGSYASYARGRGRNARRDSMGRYSREGGYSRAEGMEEMKSELQELMQSAPNKQVKQKIQELVQELDMM